MASDFRRTMIIEMKYFSTNNTVIHTENCKITVDLNFSPGDLRRKMKVCTPKHHQSVCQLVIVVINIILYAAASGMGFLIWKLRLGPKGRGELGFGSNLGRELGFGTPLQDPLYS